MQFSTKPCPIDSLAYDVGQASVLLVDRMVSSWLNVQSGESGVSRHPHRMRNRSSFALRLAAAESNTGYHCDTAANAHTEGSFPQQRKSVSKAAIYPASRRTGACREAGNSDGPASKMPDYVQACLAATTTFDNFWTASQGLLFTTLSKDSGTAPADVSVWGSSLPAS